MKPNVYLLIWQPHIKFPTLKLKHIVKKSLENSFHTKFHKSNKNLSTVTKLRLEHAVVNHRHVQGTKIQLPKSKYKNSQKLSCDREKNGRTDGITDGRTDRVQTLIQLCRQGTDKHNFIRKASVLQNVLQSIINRVQGMKENTWLPTFFLSLFSALLWALKWLGSVH